MPFVSLDSLKSHHFYKAKAMNPATEIVNDDDPIFDEENQSSKPEIEELVNIASVAEEIAYTDLANLQDASITSAGVKAPRVPLYYRFQSNIIRPAEVKVLRRLVVQSIREQSQNAAKARAKVVKQASEPVLTAEFHELHDGDEIQIRPHRSLAPADKTSKKAHRKNTFQLLQRARRFSKRTRVKVNNLIRQLRHKPTRAELINAESRLGSTIFGPVPDGHRREFFHDQENVWIWHEDWRDYHNNEYAMTVRYEVRPNGVYKKLSAGHYVQLVGQELENFRQATHVYLYLIKQKLYRYAA